MLESIYIGLTGLSGFSRNLGVIGNNVANLNTVGFKSSQLAFADLYYRSQPGNLAQDGSGRLDLGAGLGTTGTRRVFKQGELRQTGNAQDVAIDGNGFFVLRRDGQTFYTRAGQFSFDADGWLVSAAARARVAAYAGGQLQDINIQGSQTSAGKPTTRLEFSGVLNNGTAASAPYTVSNVTAFDGSGRARTLGVVFTNNAEVAPGSWLVRVNDEAGAQLLSGEIRFGSDGTPAPGFNTLSLELGAEGVPASTITLDFGAPGSPTGARSLSATASDLKLNSQDGYGVGSMTQATFDREGQLVLSYSNGQTARLDRLAIATFDALQALQPVEGSLFLPGVEEPPALGVAGEGNRGVVAPGQLELGNVDLAQEFSDLIITQRGYQASSQVINTANEMIQQLFDIKGRR